MPVAVVIASARSHQADCFLFQVLMNHLWFGKSLKEAIAAPVVFVDSQSAVKFEPRFDKVLH